MGRELLLSGVTVVDFTRILAGPYCTMLLGDLGAEVLKIEPPKGDDSRYWGPPVVDGESAYFLAVNRNKKSLTLDLKNPEALEVRFRTTALPLKAVAAHQTVLFQCFPPPSLPHDDGNDDSPADKNGERGQREDGWRHATFSRQSRVDTHPLQTVASGRPSMPGF